MVNVLFFPIIVIKNEFDPSKKHRKKLSFKSEKKIRQCGMYTE